MLTLVLVGLAGAGVGAAAAVSLSSSGLGAATTATSRCTNAGLGVIQNLSLSTVVSVTVNNLPAACGGATLQATVQSGLSSSSGSVVVAAGGGSATVTIGTPVVVGTIDEIDLVLTGP